MTDLGRTLELRPATPDDVPRLKELGVSGWETTYHEFISPANRSSYLAGPFWSLERLTTIITDQACLALVAVDDRDLPAGFLTVEPIEDGVIELTRLYVDPETRGSGIGTALVDAAIAWSHERGACSMLVNVFADNHAGRRFYERAGFSLSRVEPYAIGDQIVADAWYERTV